MACTKKCPSCERFVPFGTPRCPYCDESLVASALGYIPLPLFIAFFFFLATVVLSIFSKENMLEFAKALLATLLGLFLSPRGAFGLTLIGVLAFFPFRTTVVGAPMPSLRISVVVRLLSRLVLFVSLLLFAAGVTSLIQEIGGSV